MNKYFVSLEIAEVLKAKGFNEPCLAYYTKESMNLNENGDRTNFQLLSSKLRGELVGHGTVKNELFKWLKENDKTSGELFTLSNSVTAPLYQQVIDWFRKKHQIKIIESEYYHISDTDEWFVKQFQEKIICNSIDEAIKLAIKLI